MSERFVSGVSAKIALYKYSSFPFSFPNMTSVTEVRSEFVCRYVAPLVSVITTLYHVEITFHRQVWYRVLSLRYACIRSSGIILIP